MERVIPNRHTLYNISTLGFHTPSNPRATGAAISVFLRDSQNDSTWVVKCVLLFQVTHPSLWLCWFICQLTRGQQRTDGEGSRDMKFNLHHTDLTWADFFFFFLLIWRYRSYFAQFVIFKKRLPHWRNLNGTVYNWWFYGAKDSD